MPYDSLKTLAQDADALIEAIRAFHVRCAQDLAKAAQTEVELRREIAALKGEKEPLVWPKLDDYSAFAGELGKLVPAKLVNGKLVSAN